ncbi:MAG TPA: hypothetical protein VN884_09050 [Candidatus Sulfotelmatobacter sp.]|nr:hypothetical protein [Candidatus Sulfotelmatobacter sp.]
MKLAILFAVLLCVAYPPLSPGRPDDSAQVSVLPLEAAAVWNPSPQTLSAIREKCGRGDPSALNKCFFSEMQSAGASGEAQAFTKSFAGHGLAYVRDFRKAGLVDVAYIAYAFRANELDGVLLVNGDPSIIDVDSGEFASQGNFLKDPTYATLAKKHPHISIWPADRYHTTKPTVSHLESGGQSFVVDYVLRDGCHACAQIGAVGLAFTFDEHGRFKGVQARPAVPSP